MWCNVRYYDSHMLTDMTKLAFFESYDGRAPHLPDRLSRAVGQQQVGQAQQGCWPAAGRSRAVFVLAKQPAQVPTKVRLANLNKGTFCSSSCSILVSVYW
jgi:hypothetical protein